MRESGQSVSERNYAKEPLTKRELESIVDAAGGVAAVLNVRHDLAKARGWKAEPPKKAEFVAAALEQPNLLRRPVLVVDGRVVVGKDEGAIRALLG